MKPTRCPTPEPSDARKPALLDRVSYKHLEAFENTEREIDGISQRQRSRAAMRTASIRYRRLLEAARGGILILYRNRRRITDVNPFVN